MTIKKKLSTADILGTSSKPKATTKEKFECVICQKVIPQNRIDALIALGCSRAMWTHTQCSVTTKIKGIYQGEAGTSALILCDKVYNDSVRSVFKRASVEDSDEDGDNTED